jgi:hypothetical protein
MQTMPFPKRVYDVLEKLVEIMMIRQVWGPLVLQLPGCRQEKVAQEWVYALRWCTLSRSEWESAGHIGHVCKR